MSLLRTIIDVAIVYLYFRHAEEVWKAAANEKLMNAK